MLMLLSVESGLVLRKLVECFFHADLTASDLLQHVQLRRGDLKIAVQRGGDGVQAVFDGRITDVEDALHLLDGSVMPNECDHKRLVFRRQSGQWREREIGVISGFTRRIPQEYGIVVVRLIPRQCCADPPVPPSDLSIPASVSSVRFQRNSN